MPLFQNPTNPIKMKLNILLFTLFTSGWITGLADSNNTNTVPAPKSGPSISFDSAIHDFGKINSGEWVTNRFVFTNTGNEPLDITSVHPGCGCTTAGLWDKHVEPGAKGAITLLFNSTGFSGRVSKNATVTCNDPGQSNVVLTLNGTIWKPIEISPSLVMFSFSDTQQTNQTKHVRITNNLEESVELSNVVCTNRSFRAELETLKPGKEYELHITALPPFTDKTTVCPITVTASTERMPLLSVSAYVVVQPTVSASPDQLWISQDALEAPVKSTLAIRNSGPEPVSLSELKSNVEGIELTLKELQDGRFFNIQATFPVGFKLNTAIEPEITVKTSHPRFPLLRIPIAGQPGTRVAFQKTPPR
jgi:hypothetical protein